MTTEVLNSLFAAVDGGDLSVLPVLADALMDDDFWHPLAEQVRTYHRRGGDPLAAGWAEGGDAQARDWLRRWAGLACRTQFGTPEEVAVPCAAFDALLADTDWLLPDEVANWASRVRALARQAEGHWCPQSRLIPVELEGCVAILRWDGTFRSHR